MIKRIQTISSNTLYPYFNLALEKHLFDSVDDETVILYLWQIEQSVVYGYNQNLPEDSSAAKFIEQGWYPVRRLSDGGILFQDTGNLNFTFLAKELNFDVKKQFQILLEACRLLELPVFESDNGDLTIDGHPFSTSAVYSSGPRRLHHGTLMLEQCCPAIPMASMEKTLLKALEYQYGLFAEPISADDLDFSAINTYEKIFRDDSWIYRL